MTGSRRHHRSDAERRTNAERTASTRAKILDATARCLADFGYAKTTTTVVARLAGVSRGALLHNFPTRAQLVVAAAQHVFDQRMEQIRARAAELGDAVDRADGVIDLLFAMSRDPEVDASFEVINAGRTDPELRPLVRQLVERYNRTIGEVFAELFPCPDDPSLAGYYEAVPIFFGALVDGLALQRAAGGPATRHHDRVRDLAKLFAHDLVAFQHTSESESDCP